MGRSAHQLCRLVNMGPLCGQSVPVILRTAHRALTCVVARTPYAIALSRKCIAFIIPCVVAQKAMVASLICHWLRRQPIGLIVTMLRFMSIMLVLTPNGAVIGIIIGLFCNK